MLAERFRSLINACQFFKVDPKVILPYVYLSHDPEMLISSSIIVPTFVEVNT